MESSLRKIFTVLPFKILVSLNIMPITVLGAILGIDQLTYAILLLNLGISAFINNIYTTGFIPNGKQLIDILLAATFTRMLFGIPSNIVSDSSVMCTSHAVSLTQQILSLPSNISYLGDGEIKHFLHILGTRSCNFYDKILNIKLDSQYNLIRYGNSMEELIKTEKSRIKLHMELASRYPNNIPNLET